MSDGADASYMPSTMVTAYRSQHACYTLGAASADMRRLLYAPGELHVVKVLAVGSGNRRARNLEMTKVYYRLEALTLTTA
jgi:hypothetical protein